MLIAFLKLISFLPLSALYRLSDVLSPLAYRVYRRKVVYKNLSLVFPDKKIAEKNAIARAFYRNLLDMFVEVIKISRLSREEIERRITFEENDALLAVRNSDRPVFIYTIHLMNWEWLNTALQISVLPMHPVYKKLNNSSFDKYMHQVRSSFGAMPIEKSKSLRKAVSLKGKAGIGILADQTPFRYNTGKIWANFFNVETPFFKGTLAMPYFCQADCYFVELAKKSRGHYHATLHKMASIPHKKGDYEILKNYIKFSEQAIRKSPANWLWTHNRWKYSRKETEELIIFRSEKQD
jgi:KDO2-lipid IV(A) lauroyltransferase